MSQTQSHTDLDYLNATLKVTSICFWHWTYKKLSEKQNFILGLKKSRSQKTELHCLFQN